MNIEAPLNLADRFPLAGQVERDAKLDLREVEPQEVAVLRHEDVPKLLGNRL
jgi:hypothetical protein